MPFALEEAEPDGFFIHFLQADKIGGFATAILIVDRVTVVAQLIKGAILDSIFILKLVHRFAVERNVGPVPSLDPFARILTNARHTYTNLHAAFAPPTVTLRYPFDRLAAH